MRELAAKAADEGDVQGRLAVEAFLGAIPWHFTREIRVKRIESLKEALEEAKLRRVLEEEEEEEGKKRIQIVTEEPGLARQEERNKVRENRRGRKGPVFWGCGEEGHVLRNCELWQDFKKGRRQMKEVEVKPELNLNKGRYRMKEVEVKPELNLERGPLGT